MLVLKVKDWEPGKPVPIATLVTSPTCASLNPHRERMWVNARPSGCLHVFTVKAALI